MKKLLLIIPLLLALSLAYIYYFGRPTKTQATSYRHFEQMVKDKEIDQICIVNERYVSVILNEKGKDNHNIPLEPEYYFPIITINSFKEDLKKMDMTGIRVYETILPDNKKRFIIKN